LTFSNPICFLDRPGTRIAFAAQCHSYDAFSVSHHLFTEITVLIDLRHDSALSKRRIERVGSGVMFNSRSVIFSAHGTCLTDPVSAWRCHHELRMYRFPEGMSPFEKEHLGIQDKKVMVTIVWTLMDFWKYHSPHDKLAQ
jgi:hypothetical protein